MRYWNERLHIIRFGNRLFSLGCGVVELVHGRCKMTLIVIGVVLVICTIWFVWVADHAPLGREDEDGFHYGDKE